MWLKQKSFMEQKWHESLKKTLVECLWEKFFVFGWGHCGLRNLFIILTIEPDERTGWGYDIK